MKTPEVLGISSIKSVSVT